jgi:hypothetical protein
MLKQTHTEKNVEKNEHDFQRKKRNYSLKYAENQKRLPIFSQRIPQIVK